MKWLLGVLSVYFLFQRKLITQLFVWRPLETQDKTIASAQAMDMGGGEGDRTFGAQACLKSLSDRMHCPRSLSKSVANAGIKSRIPAPYTTLQTPTSSNRTPVLQSNESTQQFSNISARKNKCQDKKLILLWLRLFT